MKLSRLLFYILLVVLPTQLGRHFWPDFAFVGGVRIDYLSPTIYLTDILAWGIIISWLASSYLKWGKRKTKKKPNWKYAGASLFIAGFFALNIVFASSPEAAFIKFVKLLQLALLVVSIDRIKPNLSIALFALLTGAFFSSLLAWGQFALQRSIGGTVWFLGERTFTVSTPGIAHAVLNGNVFLRPYATFPHPNALAGYLVVMIPLMILLLQSNAQQSCIQKFKRCMVFPLALLFIGTIGITFSRSAWAAMLIVTAMLFVYFVRKSKKTFINKRVFLLFIGVVFLGIALTIPLTLERSLSLLSSDSQSLTLRKELNLSTLSMITQHPVLGVGLNNFLLELPEYTSIAGYQYLQPAHNVYLLITAETGLLGFFLLCFLLYSVYRGVKEKRLHEKRFFLMCAIVVVLFLALFDHYFYTLQQTMMLVAVLVGFALTKRAEWS